MKLLDCPFCGGAPQNHTQMSSRYQFVSCSRCRCDGPLKERARDAISHWNRRASPTPPTAIKAAKRIVATVAEADAMLVARALLSSPRVEEVRREALEEAAKIAEGYLRNLDNPILARACAENIMSDIRSLSLPDGEGKEKLATRASGPTAPTDRLQDKESSK